jgi:hypothetical protein
MVHTTFDLLNHEHQQKLDEHIKMMGAISRGELPMPQPKSGPLKAPGVAG